jgi:hypothetical protein
MSGEALRSGRAGLVCMLVYLRWTLHAWFLFLSDEVGE